MRRVSFIVRFHKRAEFHQLDTSSVPRRSIAHGSPHRGCNIAAVDGGDDGGGFQRQRLVQERLGDGSELAASGGVAGAVHVSRGMPEFRAYPELPSRDEKLAEDKTVILYGGFGGRGHSPARCSKTSVTTMSLTSAGISIEPTAAARSISREDRQAVGRSLFFQSN